MLISEVYNLISKKFHMFIAPNTLLMLLGLLICSASIQIPLKQGSFKCMLVYAIGHDQTIKLDINFPNFTQWTDGDHYLFSLRNTKTHQLIHSTKVGSGHFRKQIFVNEKIIYQLCFEVSSSQEITQQLLVQYNADTYHMMDSKIKIPESLLKIQEVQKLYQKSYMLSQLAHNYHDIQVSQAEIQRVNFKYMETAQAQVIFISILEIVLIVSAGFFQLVFLIKKLRESQKSFFEF